ncbi:MAG: hypothetical protein JW950_11080 [Deltaproteobacteria bacterium]|nr:hypothetical protein [Deltaproteobacteria bacterium]
MIHYVKHEETLLAVILSHRFDKEGIHFFTPDHLSQQLAFMKHPAGHAIRPHIHNPVAREVLYTQEVLLIRRGRLRVDFYDGRRNYLESRILFPGDVILLITGGHGFEALEDLEMIEVKQGPYAGDSDKTVFSGVGDNDIVIKE